MTKRPLTNHELCYVIQDYHVLNDGGLTSRFRIHIGRLSAHGDHVIALACGKGCEPRYVYPFLTMLPMAAAFVCQNCANVLRAELEGGSDAAWTVESTPASNTGVNS